METPTIFVSYSRADSEFVLKLAQDVKSAGVSIWIDQLDIQPGERWDQSVEQALNNCQYMLAVLSPSSVASNNVQDEIGFALQSGKRVVPVVCKECKIPFRLQRLEYVDFSTGYEAGLKKLLKVFPKAAPSPEPVPDPTGEEARKKAEAEVKAKAEAKAAEDARKKNEAEAARRRDEADARMSAKIEETAVAKEKMDAEEEAAAKALSHYKQKVIDSSDGKKPKSGKKLLLISSAVVILFIGGIYLWNVLTPVPNYYPMPANSSPATSGRINGRIIEAGTNLPVAGASIAAGKNKATSGADGRFMMDNVPFATYSLHVESKNYRSIDTEVVVNTNRSYAALGEIKIARASTPSPVVSTGTISGTVWDFTKNKMLIGVEVSVKGKKYHTTSGPDGGFTIRNVPFDHYTVLLHSDGYADKQKDVGVSLEQPGNLFFVGMEKIQLKTGSIVGMALDAITNNPLVEATVSLTGTAFQTTTNNAGAFKFKDVPRETYNVLVSKTGYIDMTAAGALAMTDDEIKQAIAEKKFLYIRLDPQSGSTTQKVPSTQLKSEMKKSVASPTTTTNKMEKKGKAMMMKKPPLNNQ